MENNNNKLAVTFINPRSNARVFDADLSPECTGQMAIEGLLVGDHNGPFLEPAPPGRPYELVVKSSDVSITPNTTFREAGVVNGDVIEIRQALQGA
jgi:hypothetical protein